MEELKNMDQTPLQKLLSEKREELRKMRFKANQNQLKNIRKIRVTKKNIAKIMTVLANQ